MQLCSSVRKKERRNERKDRKNLNRARKHSSILFSRVPRRRLWPGLAAELLAATCARRGWTIWRHMQQHGGLVPFKGSFVLSRAKSVYVDQPIDCLPHPGSSAGPNKKKQRKRKKKKDRSMSFLGRPRVNFPSCARAKLFAMALPQCTYCSQ